MADEPPPPLTDEEADRAKHRAAYALGRFGADGTDLVYRWALQLERERDTLEGDVGRLRTENAGLRERVKSEMLRALDALEQGSQLFDEDSFFGLRERIMKGEF